MSQTSVGTPVRRPQTAIRATGILIPVVLLLFTPDAGSRAQTVTIEPAARRQTVVGNGINFEGYQRTAGSDVMNAKFGPMMDALASDVLRIGIPLSEWEPTNDDSDPFGPDRSGFRTGGAVARSFRRLQILRSRSSVLWGAVWDVADWLVTNPGSSAQRRIAEIDEFVESITAYLVHARDAYDVEIDYISINEPSIATENGWGGYQLALTAEEQAELIRRAGARFENEGLRTRWLIAVHKVYPSELSYAKAVFADPAVRAYVAGFDFHGYWFQSGHDRELILWGNWISGTGLPAFCGECDYDNQFWQRDDRDDWSHAVESARLFHKMFTLARASGSQVWYGDAPTEGRPYRFAAQHFFEVLRPGSILVDATSSTSSVLATAAADPVRDRFGVVLQNTSSSAVTISVEGLPDGTYEWISSADGSYRVTGSPVSTTDGSIEIELGPFSINTLTSENVEFGDSGLELIGYPNPAFDAMSVRFDVASNTDVSLRLYDALGRQVLESMSESLPAGSYDVPLNLSALAAGTYFCRLTAGEKTATYPLVRLR